jgi:transposase
MSINSLLINKYLSEGATIGQISELYGRDRRTVKKWLKPYSRKLNRQDDLRILSPKQVKIVFDVLGTPEVA